MTKYYYYYCVLADSEDSESLTSDDEGVDMDKIRIKLDFGVDTENP